MKARAVSCFYAVTYKHKTEADSSQGWIVQPAWRVKVGWWKYGKRVAGPFKTRREARDAKKQLEA